MTEEQEEIAEIKSFDELPIDTRILRGIYSKGFENPSPIQKKAILPIILGRDVIAQAQSGTGKTATFVIGSLSKVDLGKNHVQLLFLAPTRELASQTYTVIQDIGAMMVDLNVKILVGGNPVYEDVNSLRSCVPHIIIGCPGRVFDMLQRKAVNMLSVKTFVIDEADEMLKSGFQDQICSIFKHLNEDVQVVLFSATFPDHTIQLTKKFMRNPYTIRMAQDQLTLEGIEQFFVPVDNEEIKFQKLKIIYEKKDVKQSIIYANSVERVIQLTEELTREGFGVCCIHSKLEKSLREDIIQKFKLGNFRIMVSTDITSRGIDIQQVSMVINYDVPRCEHNYLHRIGRSGRWGRNGIAISFVTYKDASTMAKIEKLYKKEIKVYPLL